MSDAVRLVRSGALGRLMWETTPAASDLEAAIRAVGELSPAARPRRVEVDLDADAPRALRHLLHRFGYRLEGRARALRQRPDGTLSDVLRYARLDDDPTEPRAMFTAVMNSVTPRKRLIAHVLVTDADERILLCETSFKLDWELPGGIVEPLESPATGAAREMAEEMGWGPELTGVLVVDWLRPYLGWEDALELVFGSVVVAEHDRARLVPDGHEVVALHWVPPEDLDRHMTPFGAARARSACAARARGVTLYTEAGEVTEP